jgi:hypothetical protein
MKKLEKEFVFKNKDFRKRCVTVMRIAAICAGAYMLISLINIPNCQNYPRLTVRMLLTAFYTLELCLFAHRNSIYMELGGDYALARRAGAGMMVSLIVNSIVEGYYVSAFLEIDHLMIFLREKAFIVYFRLLVTGHRCQSCEPKHHIYCSFHLST